MPAAFDPLIAALKHPDAIKQMEAAMKPPGPVARPGSGFEMRTAWIAARALDALASIGPPAFDPLERLTDSSAALRALAAEGLGLLGDQRAVMGLSAALKDPDERVRRAATDALRKLAGGR